MPGSGILPRRAALALAAAALVALTLACSAPTASAPAAPPPPPVGTTSTPAASGASAPAGDALTALQPPVAVRFASSATNANQTVLYVARDQGFFTKYGLDVEVSLVGASTVWQAALTNGELDYVQSGLPGIASGLLAGQDRVTIGAVVNLTDGNIYSGPELTGPRDLSGKGVATTRFGSNSDLAIRLVLPRYGLEPDTDVRIVQTGGFPEAWAALRTGAVAAAYLDPPLSFAAEDANFKALISANVQLGPTQFVTTRATVARQPEVPTRLLAAMMEAVHAIVTDQPVAIAAYTKQLGINDPVVLERTYQSARTRYQRDLLTNPEAVQNVVSQMAKEQPRAAELTYEALVDNNPLRRVYASGLYERLWNEPPLALPN